ncbi:sensor histidine kinase [Marinilabilia rubra]|uniref:histidine kinase n=1 Tax=Marinilabilia rubra TaxID=2162893 RepID=A0A2U2BCC6_9BACT|nr:PAS domain-containing sensor histidine kinase [Marinilabilia rubra]PWE00725.1 PAS domain-containing sensor histidine kinase [Marinilabilia rubra]
MIKEQQLVKALDNSEGIIVITDSEGHILFVNKTFEKIYGYTRDEVTGKRPSILKSGFHSKAFYQDLWATISSGKSWNGDLINRSRSGELIVEKASISPIFSDDEDKITGYVAVKHNISEKKRLKEQLEAKEQLFEKLFENSPVGIFVMEALESENEIYDFQIKRANLRSSVIFNRISFIDCNLSFILGNINIRRILQQHKTIQQGELVFEWNSVLKDKIIEFKLFSLGTSQYCLLASDISSQLEMERKLKKSEAHLRELNETKDKIFSIIAHDLRSPFQAIIGFATLLNDGMGNSSIEELKDMSAQITDVSEKTYKLLDDLLTWSKSQLGQLSPVLVSLNLYELVEKVMGQMSMLANKKKIELVNGINKDIALTLDKDMLEFVIRNLVHNGIKFTNIGGEVKCYSSIEDDNVFIHVKDTGIGIQQAKQKGIFSLSGNLSTNGTSEEAGTGLGLMLSREMVELNEGQISLESNPGEGSCFTLSFKRH